MHAEMAARPYPTVDIETEAVERPHRTRGEDLAAARDAPCRHVDVVAPYVPRTVRDVAPSRIRDVQVALVDGQRKAVRTHHVGDDRSHLARARVDAIHVARSDLTLCRVALFIAVDAVRRVGEPHAAVRRHDDVVGAVEALALE